MTDGRSMATSVFTFSNEQAEAITHRGGHLQVVACVGAGGWWALLGAKIA